MEYSEFKLVPDHLPRDHPLVSRDYSLYTPAIEQMVSIIARWLDDQVDGATIYGASRLGKSSAVDNWLESLLSARYGGFIPMVIWSHSDSGGASSSGRFYANLLEAAKHHLAKATRSPKERLSMLIERFEQLSAQAGGRFVVLVIDEAQGMTVREWLWLVELHSLLEKRRLRLCVLSIASVQFRDDPVNLALAGGAHVAARFLLTAERFHGITNVSQLAYVMSGYDEGSEWPAGSGISFTAGVVPKLWAVGFKLAMHAEPVWSELIKQLPYKYDGPIEIPMKTISTICRRILQLLASGRSIDDVFASTSISEIVEHSGHATLMAIISAGAPRGRKQ